MRTDAEAVSAAYPGQFMNIYPEGGDRLVLPRPFGICDADPSGETVDIVYEVVGAGTRRLSGRQPGHVLRAALPLGKGFDLTGIKEQHQKDPRPVVLVGGGVGCAPMLFLAKTLKKEGISCMAVLGFREVPFLGSDFTEAGCSTLITTEKLNDDVFLGTVIDCMEVNSIHAPEYFACGPRGMLAAVEKYVAADCGDEHLQVSLEERMGCGYGVCVGCSTEIRERDESGGIRNVRRKICSDGPVFRGSEVIWNDRTR